MCNKCAHQPNFLLEYLKFIGAREYGMAKHRENIFVVQNDRDFASFLLICILLRLLDQDLVKGEKETAAEKFTFFRISRHQDSSV